MTTEGPYFQRDDTLRHIETIANESSLVIYVGAGVSIDTTGLQWEHLIARLLDKRIDIERQRGSIRSTSGELYRQLLAQSPLQLASVVKQMYLNDLEPKDADQHIAHDIRDILYSRRRTWRRAQIARSIVALIGELKRQGKAFYVVTTNYDDCLQRELELLNGERRKRGEARLQLRPHVPKVGTRARSQRSQSGSSKFVDPLERAVNGAVASDRIVHLHGYVPESGGKTEAVTLSEMDYARAYPLSSAILGRLFRTNAVLILGSSLTDPPLISALANSAREIDELPLRLAVVPMQGFGISEMPERVDLKADVINNVMARMKTFGVQVTFPDFYSQVGQLVTEVRVCMQEARSSREYRDTDSQYGRRLKAWWDAWESPRKDDWEKANIDDHEILKKCLRELQAEFKRDSMEVEIWIRWKPGSKNRQLRLWASSNAAWPDVDSRTAEISGESPYLSVKTFSYGRVEQYPPDDRRQRKMLCVPVKVGSSEQRELPVTVISLAYALSNGDQEFYALDTVKIIAKLAAVGEMIATPH